jgi:hypothetical protein
MNWLGKLALDWLYGKIQGLVLWIFAREKMKDEAKKSVQPLKDAKTAEEIDAATDSALNKF